MKCQALSLAVFALAVGTASGQTPPPWLLDISASSVRHDGMSSWRSNEILLSRNRLGSRILLVGQFSERGAGDGLLAGAGYVRDWTPRVYTYAAGSLGTGEAEALPRSRIDAEVGAKWLESGRLVTSLGFSTIRYRESRRDDVLATSLTFRGPLVVTARYYENRSYPGGVDSHAQLLQVGREEPFRRSLFVRYSWGNEAYLSITADTEPVNSRSRTWSASYREWLTSRGGILVDAAFQRRDDGFERRWMTAGVFVSFGR